MAFLDFFFSSLKTHVPDHSVFKCIGGQGFSEAFLMLLVTVLQYGLFSSKVAFAGCGLAF